MPSPLTSPAQPTPVPVWARSFSPSMRIVRPATGAARSVEPKRGPPKATYVAPSHDCVAGVTDHSEAPPMTSS